jgi:YfiH family protein
MHAVTMKSGDAPFKLSLALHTGELESHIVANRKLIEKSFSQDGTLHFVLANQTHSDNIHIVTNAKTKGWLDMKSAIADCDALVTNQKGVMLGVLTADCVPVLLYDPKEEVVAAVHAGWKGTKEQIVAKTVQKMKEVFGSDPAEVIAGIAPAIGKCCYEVGEDVAEHFFDIPDACKAKGNKYMLDLPYINKYQLLDTGLRVEHIEMSGICTACETSKFFSYRKEEGCSGRFMSLIGISPKAK